MLDRDGLIAKLAPEWYAEWIDLDPEERAIRVRAHLGVACEPEATVSPTLGAKIAGRVMARELNAIAGATIQEVRQIDNEMSAAERRGAQRSFG